FMAHRGQFVILQWDDASLATGEMGNLVFLHERIAAGLLPDVLASASSLAGRALEQAEMFARAADERLALIEKLERECELRLQRIEELSGALQNRLGARGS